MDRIFKNWDFILVIVTIVLLALLGVQSFGGTVYSWFRVREDPDWTATYVYGDYLKTMNYIAGPLALGIIIALGLCIPKRVIKEKYSLAINQGVLLAFLGLAYYGGLVWALGIFMFAAVGFQLAVLLLTLFTPGLVRFEKQGFYIQLGSVLLHLGTVLFLADFIALQGHPFHLALFWTSMALITIGSTGCFYALELESLIRRLRSVKR